MLQVGIVLATGALALGCTGDVERQAAPPSSSQAGATTGPGTAAAPTTPPAFALNKVTDLRILISRAAKDTQLETADNKTL